MRSQLTGFGCREVVSPGPEGLAGLEEVRLVEGLEADLPGNDDISGPALPGDENADRKGRVRGLEVVVEVHCGLSLTELMDVLI